MTGPRPRAQDLALVALGAAVGAVARWGISHAEAGVLFPWATLGINVAGAFLLGLLPVLPVVRHSHRATVLLGPGLLGGFTTVSSWSGQVTGLARDGHAGMAGTYLVGTVAAARVAARLGRRLAHRPEPEDALT